MGLHIYIVYIASQAMVCLVEVLYSEKKEVLLSFLLNLLHCICIHASALH